MKILKPLKEIFEQIKKRDDENLLNDIVTLQEDFAYRYRLEEDFQTLEVDKILELITKIETAFRIHLYKKSE